MAAGLAAFANGQATQPVSSIPSGAPVVDLGYVSYLGSTNDTSGITYYRGIHYAQPPVGALRWQKPRPIEQANDFEGATLNATQAAPSCYQSAPESLLLGGLGSLLTESLGVPQSEDCLVLDVLVPSRPQSDSLPVIVMIHGGGYTLGGAQSSPGDAMVHASNGSVIYVSIQYRLGIHGFLGGSQIANDGVRNAGLLDQRAALEWVSRNIHAFGGDSSRVTIWGPSAGGGSVTHQLTAGGAYDEPPFSAAIAEHPWWQPLLNSSQQEIQFSQALRLANCSSVHCLRELSSEALGTVGQAVQNASWPGATGYGSSYYGPVVDGAFIRELPDQAFKAGRFYDVPLLVEHSAYEGLLFSNTSETTQAEQVMDAMDLFPYAGPAFFSRLYQLYPASDFNSSVFQRQAWFGDFIISCPTYYMASRAVDVSRNASAVFKLIFAAGTEIHGATGPFLQNADIEWAGANNRTLAEIMTAYWISFAVTHDPNPLRDARAPYWPSYVSGGSGTVAEGESVGFSTLAVTYASIGPQQDPDMGAKCDFFGSNGLVVRN
ncbi:hypothetical protein KVR01_005515 [Diaporthe batatas]|uniref:uncharacterized protein n=1 Tax=Diaporthe batatas TaxID=748121 RepID=UPI001D0555D5|nr:uncharacterized protein KVR01_005515 [Diaporthe batatas]KAG8165240.1 hypothetical protein KVR01_005515 [Diaporthe batatas]